MRRISNHPEAGFTFIELLIVIAIMGVLFSVLYGVFLNVTESQQRVRQDSDIFHQTRLAFDLMGNDIAAAMTISKRNVAVFVGSDSGYEGKEEDSLLFSSLSRRSLPVPTSSSSQALLNYFLKQDAEGDTFTLYRAEVPQWDGSFSVDATPVEIAFNLRGLNMRYFNGSDWSDSWDSRSHSGDFPRAVSIEITIAGETPEESAKFATVVTIPSSEKEVAQ